MAEVQTDNKGWFHFEKLSPGRYRVESESVAEVGLDRAFGLVQVRRFPFGHRADLMIVLPVTQVESCGGWIEQKKAARHAALVSQGAH